MVLGGIKLALINAKNTFSTTAMKVAMIGVVLIPVIFAGAYLSAFLDPYANIDTISVAVVNEDKGAEIGGENRNVGEEVCDKLNDAEQALGWTFVDAKTAAEGLDDGTFYMTCTIPSDFSERIASADTDDPEKACLMIEYNESKNMLASQIGGTAWEKVQTIINQSVIDEYWQTVLTRSADGADDLQDAVDGTQELHDGLGDAIDGNNTITENLTTLTEGAQTLESGLSDLKDGASQVEAGTKSLASGLTSLESGAGQVSSGAATLAEQASSLSALPAATQQLAAGAGQVSDGAAQLSAAVAASGISDSTSQAVAALSAAEQYIQAGDTTTAMAYLSAVKDQLSASGATVSALASSIDTLSAGAAQVSAGATQLSESVSEEKITALTNGISALSSGATQVSEGVTSASSGAKTLASGTPALTSGASSAQSGAGDIASGAQQLADGSTELGDGLIEAQDGTQELNDGLTDAVDSLAMTQAQIDAKAEQMSQPVELDESYLTSVKNYGTGFAPFFLGLAMWVGAIFAGFVFHPLNPRLSLSRANPVMTAFSGYLPMGAFAIVQALIALAFVQFALHVQINNVAAYYAIGLLTSVVFMAIMQFLVGAFGFPGRFVAVVLLTLQLTSASGTFPVSTAPAFFQALAPFMPLTYVVEAMREVMTGLDFTLALTDCGIIAIYGIVAFALTCLVAWRKRVVTVQTLHPLLEL